ncbi:MAG TPA: PAS domain S-box protein [Streptosporangiaceae bacterium]|nr:PAS domain S-box protein [Streptosporangiaceae bacterium]
MAGGSHREDSADLAEVRAQLRELQQLVEAIRSGSVDSLIIGPPGHEQVHHTADRSYRLIVEAMNEGAATVSTDGVILGANPRLGSMTGQDASELLGTSALDLIAEAHRPAFDRLLDVAIGESARGEADLIRSDGTTVPVLLAVSGFDLDGMLLRCLVLTDLTALRAAESQAVKAHEAVREQNTFLEQAQEALGLGWWASAPDEDGTVTWSPRAHRIYGLAPAQSEVTVATLRDLIHPDDMAAVAEARGTALAGGARYQVEHRIVRPDGVLRWVLQAAVVERDDAGVPVRLMGICQDITDRKRSEDEIRAAAAALLASEVRLRVLFDHAPIGVGEVTLSGELVRVNQYFCQFVGYTADEVLSMRGMTDLLHPDEIEAHRAIRERISSEGIDTYSADRRFVQKGGGVIWGEVQRSLVRDPAGRPLLYIDTVRDITAQREAEAEVGTLTAELEARVEQRTAELELSNKNLRAFSYSIAHDLRTPLRGLHGFSEALLEEYGELLGETGRGYAQRIQAASERMGTIIDDLLRLSQVTQADMNLVPVDLSAQVAAIAENLGSRDPGRRVSFAIQEGVWVTADPILIRTVLDDLVENAWKFTAGREDAAIEFATAATGEDATVCCYLRDNGVGFEPAYVHKLFQPFQRLHTTREFPGTGVGLASVQRIIERHGGRVWAQGAVDGGATFFFTLDAKDRAR